MPVHRLVFGCLSPSVPGVAATGVTVRVAHPERDAEAIVAVTKSSLVADGFQPRARGVLADLESRHGRSVTGLLATLGGVAVGCAALVSAGEDTAVRHSIAWLFVCDHARRRGVGRVLVAAAVDAARARGAGEVWAETRSDWSTAVAFWSAVGFRPVA